MINKLIDVDTLKITNKIKYDGIEKTNLKLISGSVTCHIRKLIDKSGIHYWIRRQK